MSRQLLCMISIEGKTSEQIYKELKQGLTHFEATKLGLKLCEKCGEYCGISVKDGQGVEVDCICNGIFCRKCGVTKIHRPISNHFNEEEEKIVHTPYFLSICGKCRKPCK